MQGKIVSASLDWITYVTTEKSSTESLMAIADDVARKVEGTSLPYEYWAGLGYKGQQLGPVKFGVRKDGGGIMIISGSHASKGLILAELAAGHPTRVDLEVTFHVKQSDVRVAARHYEQLLKLHEGRKRVPALKLIMSSTGHTLYVGKRTAPVMLRLYDKTYTYEPGKLGSYWRYEVEFKKQAARDIMARIVTSEDIGVMAASSVLSEYRKRSIRPSFSAKSEVDAIEVRATVSTMDAKIAWLEKCVAPVVVQLSLGGYNEQVIKALKLRSIMSEIGRN